MARGVGPWKTPSLGDRGARRLSGLGRRASTVGSLAGAEEQARIQHPAGTPPARQGRAGPRRSTSHLRLGGRRLPSAQVLEHPARVVLWTRADRHERRWSNAYRRDVCPGSVIDTTTQDNMTERVQDQALTCAMEHNRRRDPECQRVNHTFAPAGARRQRQQRKALSIHGEGRPSPPTPTDVRPRP